MKKAFTFLFGMIIITTSICPFGVRVSFTPPDIVAAAIMESIAHCTKVPVYVPGSIRLHPEEEIFGELTLNIEDPFPLEYRYCYYYSYSSYWTLVDDQDAYDEWAKSVPRTKDYYPNGPELEMPLVTLIKHFKIPKCVFVAEVKRLKKILSSFEWYDPSDELQEFPNADIIYTFNNELINYYYRRA